MSDCCGNPGVGYLPNLLGNPTYDTYNPSEVRLYGRPATDITRAPVLETANESEIRSAIESDPAYMNNFSQNNDEFWRLFDRVIEAANRRIEANRQALTDFIDTNMMVSIRFDDDLASLPITLNLPGPDYGAGGANYIRSIGIIYGYAYEGHCYKMPKPQIMLLPAPPRNITGDDRGCDCGYSPVLGYAVWQLDKRQRVVALDVRSDDLKTVVLDENLPGNRSPQAYGQSMSLAPMRARD
ncbi:hypothetical protein JNB88_30340 [Rhizobium cauense]|uniref:hypothetical protein n=1 Tax=Rhizobium cauense TaxID=1166683 RepID=UPI001C6E8213|nr:hypothetical protein [Rhizobium cauense]MBW9117919.1 hypothetical protein [Rhizobium cauense]